MNEFSVDLTQYFLEGNDDEENPIVVSIRNIEIPTRICFEYYNESTPNIMFDDESKDRTRQRLRHLFRVISRNRYINELLTAGDEFKIPGVIIAEWICSNKFVSKLFLLFKLNHSDMQLLCDALQQDTTIITIGFHNFNLPESDLHLFGKALRENRRIRSVEYFVDLQARLANIHSLTILKDALSPGTNIKSLVLNKSYNYGFGFDINSDFANQVENILLINSSLSLLRIDHGFKTLSESMPIFRGVAKSTITEFHFLCCGMSSERNDIDDQNETLEIVAKMKRVKLFSFHFIIFSQISGEIIASALKSMPLLDTLEIDICWCKTDQVKDFLQELSTWERTYKLKLIVGNPRIDMTFLLKSVQLESFTMKFGAGGTFDEIIEEIPNWRFLKNLDVFVDTNFRYLQNPNFQRSVIWLEDAVTKNSSLRKISVNLVVDGEFTFGYVQSIQLPNTIERILERNERFAECKDNPDRVPLKQWPELLAMADITGLDFAYECVRKIPDVFIALLRKGVEQGDSLSDCVNCFHNKREASPADQNMTTKKRSR